MNKLSKVATIGTIFVSFFCWPIYMYYLEKHYHVIHEIFFDVHDFFLALFNFLM